MRLGSSLCPAWWVRRSLERGLVFSRAEIVLSRVGEALDGLRVAFLSDLHAGAFLRESDLCRVFERLARLEPELVLLGGDLVDSSPEDVLELRRPLELLEPPLGIYAVPGNHDYFAEQDLVIWRGVLASSGVRVLENQGQRVKRGPAGLWLAGVEDLDLGRPDLAGALLGCAEEEPILLISHQPDMFHEAAYVGVDLQLSGHTHGGQVCLLGQAPWVRSHTRLGYRGGLFEADGAQLYVGRGAGMTLLPVRIGAPAEVCLIELRGADPEPEPRAHPAEGSSPWPP
jgi:predicted MPP superfamily phosphohydrolase